MKNEDNNMPGQAAEPVYAGQSLRQKAEEIVRETENSSSAIQETSPEETRDKLHELLVHQIELEMQNDELRCAQADLEEARARYVDLYDFAPVGYCTVSEKGLILEINLTAASLLGVARGALINKPISKFIVKEDQDVYYIHKLQLFRTDEPQTCELRMTKSDGTVFWAQLDAITLQDARETRISRVVLSDITGRKEAETALQESEKRQAFLLKLSDALRPLSDAKSIQDAATSLLSEYLGASQSNYSEYHEDAGFAEIKQENTNGSKIKMKGTYKLDDYTSSVAILRTGCDLVIPDVLTFSKFSKEERERWAALNIRSSIVVPLIKEGKLVITLAVRNTTPRKWTPQEVELVHESAERTWAAVERARVEEALHKSEEKFRVVQELSPDGLTILRPVRDDQGQIVDFTWVYENATIARLNGTDPTAVTGQRLLELFPGHLGTPFLEAYLQVAETGETRFFDAEYGLESMTKPTWFRIAVVRMNEDIAVLAQDITERKRTEEALKDSEQKAITLVTELEKADRNKNEFISTLSHEIRNPLAAITAAISLLELTSNKELVRKAKETMKRQSVQLCRLVDDLLDLTRITMNKIHLKKERIELSKIVAAAAEDYKMQFEEKGVQLVTNITADSLFLQADSARLTQIIGNLLHNAVKFTETGGTTLLEINKNKNQAIISVKDDGIGIDPEILPDIFKPFVQLDNSIDRSNGGLGLGLAIVKGMVELHGGSVFAFSEGLGKGTQFTIHMPLSSEKNNDQKGKNLCEKPSRSFRILLIEDNIDLADILCTMLRVLGHNAISAGNGIDGLAKVKEFQPDVIFCDIGLPGMSGYDVARNIRSDDMLIGIFMVALTGYAEPKDIELALNSGFNKHMSKPVNLELLSRILSEVP